MIYEQHFNSLSGLRFSDCAIAQFTLPQPSVVRLEIPEQYGFCRAYFYVDFPSPVDVKSIEITTIGALGAYGNGSAEDYLNFEILVEDAPTYRYSVSNPLPARIIVIDDSANTKLSSYVAFGIERNGALTSRAYVDIDHVKITYESQEEPLITKKSLYRYKIASATAGRVPVFFKRDGVTVASQCINFREHCTNGKVLKFMDRNGIYRFFPFNEFWEQNNEPDAIGSTELFTDSIYTGQSNKRSLGYKNKRSIAAVAYDVTAYELDILQDLMTTPFVYLYIGTTGDAPKDWLLVEVSGTNTGRRRKGVIGRYEVTIVLPEQFNITML